MHFYIPPSKERNDLRVLIERYGGRITEIHECFTYQIAPLQEDVSNIEYFHGDVFLAHWLVESVKEGRLLDPENYLAFTNHEKGSKRVDFICNKLKYTITEGIKVFELALANPKNARGSAFWLKVQRSGVIPVRSGHSMRTFWKLNAMSGLEAFITKSVEDEHRFCHAFKHIPAVTSSSIQTSA